jgi:hypothetical protein
MTDERDVRGWLAAAEAPKLRLDLRQTVQTGREKARQRRIRRIAGTVALGLAALVAVPGAIAIASRDRTDSLPDVPAVSVSVSASAFGVPATIPDAGPDACRYHLLPVPDDPSVRDLKDPTVAVADTDPTGRWAVGSIVSGDRSSQLMILWENGNARLMPPETKNGFPTAVNEQGQVLGKSGLNEFGAVGSWVYRNGSFDRLGIPADAVGHDLSGINAAGDVLGYLTYHPAGAVQLQSRGVIWKAGDLSRPQPLPNARVSVNRFSSDGAVLGALQPGSRPYIWTGQGTGKELTGPGDLEAPELRDANGDWVVGDTGMGQRVFRWRLSTGERTELTAPDLPGFRVDGVRGLKVRPDGTVTMVGRRQAATAGVRNPLLLVRGDERKELPVPDRFIAGVTEVSVDGSVVYGQVMRLPDPENPQPGDLVNAPVYWTC